jgi:hypothetical protein
MDDFMRRSLELAGFIAAHGIWCVSDGETLIPILARETPDGSRQMLRLAADQLEDGVAQGKEKLSANSEGHSRAVLVFDGFVTLDSGKTDALFVEIRSYDVPSTALGMDVPYRNAADPRGFAVYRPKFISFTGSVEPDYAKCADWFFAGVDSHTQAAKIWNAAIDQSI